MKIFFSLILLLFTTVCFTQRNCNVNVDSVLLKNKPDIIELADSLAVQKLEIKTRRKDIPRFIRKTIKCWFGEFKIADIGKSFNPTDMIWGNEPRSRIKFLGINEKYLILAFEQGGIGKTDHIEFFEFNNKKILKFWSGYDYILGEITRGNVMEHIFFSINRK